MWRHAILRRSHRMRYITHIRACPGDGAPGARHKNGGSGRRCAIGPIILEPATYSATTQSDDGVGAANGPEHSGAFEPSTDDDLTTGFHDTGTNKQTLCAKGRIAHPLCVAFKVFGFVGDGFGEFVGAGRRIAQDLHQGLNLAALQAIETAGDPLSETLAVIRKQLGRQVPQMLASMIEVDDLNGAWKVLIGEIPDPDRAVADHHLLLGPAPATPPGFGIESETEGFGGLDGGNVGCGALIAHGPSL